MIEPNSKAGLLRYLQEARDALLWKLDGNPSLNFELLAAGDSSDSKPEVVPFAKHGERHQRAGIRTAYPARSGRPSDLSHTFSGESRFRSIASRDQLSGGLSEASRCHDFGGSGRGAVCSQNPHLDPSHRAAEAG
ncbi:hypothetical protein [Streptomyces sp. BE230]|uniref:hypothetical protein n=1 Tax=Streptomyces sp. BE230 TaxID=3002526 RepID=UPI002ED66FFB|nr:hypothetical protein [Streptomyces sp. BE230]